MCVRPLYGCGPLGRIGRRPGWRVRSGSAGVPVPATKVAGPAARRAALKKYGNSEHRRGFRVKWTNLNAAWSIR